MGREVSTPCDRQEKAARMGCPEQLIDLIGLVEVSDQLLFKVEHSSMYVFCGAAALCGVDVSR